MQFGEALILVPVPEAHEPFGIMAAENHVLEAVNDLVLEWKQNRNRLNERVNAADIELGFPAALSLGMVETSGTFRVAA